MSTVQGYVDDLEKKTQHITHTATDNGHYTTIEDHTNFNSDGSIDAVNGQFRVTSDGGLLLKDEDGNKTFKIYNSTGGMEAAKGQFKVNGKTGEVSVGKKGENEYAFTVNKDGDISTSGTLSVSNGKFAVDTDGNTKVDGTMVIQGKTIINANADIKGSLEAAGNKFKVDGNTGEVTAPKGNIGGVILETTDDDKSKVKADKADIGGVIIKDKGIEAGTVQINKGSATDNRVLDVNGNFAVYNDGAFKAAGENFVVKATGDVTANSYRNANGTFTADETGLVTATKAQIDNVTIGGEDPSAAIKVSDDNFIVYNDGAFQAAGRKFLVNNQGEMTAAAATVDNVVIDNNQVTGLSNTTWNPEDPDSIVEDRAATEGQLEDFQSQVGETIGTGDFSRTNYASGAENVTDAIYGVDAQVKVNSDALDAYEAAGIVAGNKVGQYSKAIALGNNATANGWSAVAIGSNAKAEGSNSVAIGVDSASGALSTAVGAGSKAGGTQATALGQNSNALGHGAVSLGANSEAVGEGAVSIGFNNSAEVAGSVAIGNGAHVYEGGTNSVALGQWSQASDDRVVSVGNDWLKRRITNVAAGTDPTDAVNVQQLTDRTANMVEWDEGTKDTIHGVTLNGGTISAADGKFNVWSSGGVEATYGKFDTSIEAADGNFKVNGTTGGITTAGGIEAARGITAANGNFNVWNSGGMEAKYGVFEGKITAANDKFEVNGATGDITTDGQITAANDKFHVWGTGGIAAGEDKDGNYLFTVSGVNGDVTTQGNVVAKDMYVGSVADDNAVVTVGDMTNVVGDADFSGTNYASEAENVTEAIYDVDSQVKVSSDVLAGYETSGIVAGLTNGEYGVAMGEDSANYGESGVAVGHSARTEGFGSVALGAYAAATGNDSVAIGFNSQASEDKVVSVGGYAPGTQRRVINVADGVNDNDAVNVQQLTDRTANMVEWDENTDDTIHGVTLENGMITAAEGNFKVYGTGGIYAADGMFQVNGNTGDVSAKGNLKAADGKFFVNGNNGSITAANGDFKVSSTGDVTAAGSLTAAGEKFKVYGASGGFMAANGKVKVNGYTGDIRTDGKVTANEIHAANDNFIVYESGVVKLNDGNLVIGTNGDLNSKGTITGNILSTGGFVANADGNAEAKGTVTAHTLSTGADGFIANSEGDFEARNAHIDGTLLVGEKFKVTPDGELIAANSAFKVGADGTITAANGNFVVTDDPNSGTDSILNIGEDAFRVNENGGFVAGNGNFKVFSNGGVVAAGGDFKINSETGAVTTTSVTGLTNTDWDTTHDYSDSTLAATEAQLQAVAEEAGKHTQVTVNGDKTDGNLKVTSTDNDGQTTYDISLSDTVTVGNGIKGVTLNGGATKDDVR